MPQPLPRSPSTAGPFAASEQTWSTPTRHGAATGQPINVRTEPPTPTEGRATRAARLERSRPSGTLPMITCTDLAEKREFRGRTKRPGPEHAGHVHLDRSKPGGSRENGAA